MIINIADLLDNNNININDIETQLSYINNIVSDTTNDIVHIDELLWINEIHRSEILHQIYLDVISLLKKNLT